MTDYISRQGEKRKKNNQTNKQTTEKQINKFVYKDYRDIDV